LDKRPANNGTVVLHKFTWARQVCTITPTTGVASVRILHPTLLPGLLHTVRTEDQSERTLHLKHTMLCLGQTQRLMTWGRHRLVMYNTCLPPRSSARYRVRVSFLLVFAAAMVVRCSLEPIPKLLRSMLPQTNPTLLRAPRTNQRLNVTADSNQNSVCHELNDGLVIYDGLEIFTSYHTLRPKPRA
jgi:hypothetical protein